MKKFIISLILANLLAITTCVKDPDECSYVCPCDECPDENSSTTPSDDGSMTTEEDTATAMTTTTTETITDFTEMTTKRVSLFCPEEDTYERFLTRVFEVTFKYLNKLIKTEKDTAVVCLPLATLYMFASFAIYSYGRTQKKLLRALGLDNPEQVRCSLKQIDQYLNADYANTIPVAIDGSFIFASLNYLFTEAYKKDLEELIIGHAYNINTDDSTAARNTINNIVENVTGIANVITSPYIINSKTKLLVVSALSIQIQLTGFDCSQVTTGPYYNTPSKTTQTEYVTKIAVLRYTESESLRCKILIQPCGGAYELMMIMPNSNTASARHRVLKMLGNYKTFTSVYQSLEPTQVVVKMPYRMNITTAFNSKKLIRQILPVSIIYHPKAQFQNMIVNDKPVYVTDQFQKISFQINYTSGSKPMKGRGLPGAEFICNRPCIFVTLLKGVPLFTGTL